MALYTDTFPEVGLAALRARGIAHQRIDYLLPASGGRDYSADPRFYDCWSKLAPFSLTQYSRVGQLDADMLVLRNMDELLEDDKLPLDDPEEAARETYVPRALPPQPGSGGPPDGVEGTERDPTRWESNSFRRVFAAGHACVCNPLRKPHYPRDWIPEHCAFTTQHSSPDTAQHTAADPLTSGPLGYMNGGLQIVRPSRALFAHIVEYMNAFGDELDFADQSVLTGLFRGRWVALPYVYNALKTMRWDGVHKAIWKDECVKNVHYILAPKPWDEEHGQETDETHAWWHRVNAERKTWERENGVSDDGF